MLARLVRVFLAAAFLLAQQSAFAHQLWHSANGTKTSVSPEQGKKGNPLCEQHDALGTVLGALSAAPLAAPVVETPPVHFPAASVAAVCVPAPSPVSRGPPAPL
jgi:hypothetical protein